jgi:electron transport complex protein RnfE
VAENKTSLGKELTKGIIKENPTLVMLLGMCPTLAVTTQAKNGIGMGLATTFVLLGSNIVVSLLRKVIPDKVRIPAFIVIIASFVTLIGFLLEGFLPDLYDSLGIYLTLITVNCIIFGRAEMFASKNNVVASACDAIGMGIGFTLALFLMGSAREILGAGQWLGMNLPVLHNNPMLLFIMPAGGFFTLGVIIAAVNKLSNKKPPQELGCKGCPNAENCSKNGGDCK